MSVSQTSNASNTPPEFEEASWDEEELGSEGEPSFEEAPDAGSDSFGDQPQNVTKDQILKLLHKVEAGDRPDEKELLDTLREALKSLQDFNPDNDDKAAENYEQVFETVGGVDESGEAGVSDGSSNPDSEGVEGSEAENTETKISGPILDKLKTQMRADGVVGTEEEIDQKIQKALSESGLDVSALPTPPDETVFQFLKAIDPKLEAAFKSPENLKPEPSNAHKRGQASEALAKCLTALGYPDVKTYNDKSFPLQSFYTYSQTAGFMKMGDQVFEINFSDASGKTSLKPWTFDTTKPLPLVDPQSGAQLAQSNPVSKVFGLDITEKWWGWWDTTTGQWQVVLASDSEALEEFNSHDGDDVDEPGNNPFSLGGTNRFNPTNPASWGSENTSGTVDWHSKKDKDLASALFG